jgi:alginate O-acetyltransferase complex protein AlgJ
LALQPLETLPPIPQAPGHPAQRVIQGKDGWLYLADDFRFACDPKFSLPAVMDGLRRLHTAIEASGRKLVISVIPDKSTAIPQYLPESFAFKSCGEEHRKEFWQQIVASNLPFVDIREPLAEAERAARHPMYRRLDTHWNVQGAAVWDKSVLAALDPKLIEGMTIPGVDHGAPSGDSSFVAGQVIDALGGLTVMLGAPRKEPMLQIRLRRKGVTLSSDGVPLPGNVPPQIRAVSAGTTNTTEASTTAAPLYPGHTLILGDSFYDNGGGSLFAPFMSTLTAVHVLAGNAKITQNIIDADTVVLEVVERSVSAGGVPLIQPDALVELERSLAAHHR